MATRGKKRQIWSKTDARTLQEINTAKCKNRPGILTAQTEKMLLWDTNKGNKLCISYGKPRKSNSAYKLTQTTSIFPDRGRGSSQKWVLPPNIHQVSVSLLPVFQQHWQQRADFRKWSKMSIHHFSASPTNIDIYGYLWNGGHVFARIWSLAYKKQTKTLFNVFYILITEKCPMPREKNLVICASISVSVLWFFGVHAVKTAEDVFQLYKSYFCLFACVFLRCGALSYFGSRI